MTVGADRKRGILTRDDRDYFRGRKNYDSGTERNTRQRIRDRTRNALYDFKYLSTDLASRDVAQIAMEDGTANDQLFNAAKEVIAFLFKLCQHAPDSEAYTTDDRFREILRKGIENGLAEEHTVLDFKLDLQYGLPREAKGRIRQKLHRGESLTLAELREAVNNDYLDDSFRFRPLDQDGFPKNVEPEDTLSKDDY